MFELFDLLPVTLKSKEDYQTYDLLSGLIMECAYHFNAVEETIRPHTVWLDEMPETYDHHYNTQFINSQTQLGNIMGMFIFS